MLLEAAIVGLPVLTTASCGYAFHILEAGAGLVCAEPFDQAELNRNLRSMLTSGDRAVWRSNGIAYGRQEMLYAMPKVAVDYLEKFAGSRNNAAVS